MNPSKYKNLRLPGKITTPFGGNTRSEPIHGGIDVANVAGTPVPSLADGVVLDAGPKTNGLGNSVTIQDKTGNIHKYSHLQKIKVGRGQRIARGQDVGPMGSSGNSYSPSGGDPTHVDIRISGKGGQMINPIKYL